MIYAAEDLKRVKLKPADIPEHERFLVSFGRIGGRRYNRYADSDSSILFIPPEEMDTREIKKKLESLGYETPVVTDMKKI